MLGSPKAGNHCVFGLIIGVLANSRVSRYPFNANEAAPAQTPVRERRPSQQNVSEEGGMKSAHCAIAAGIVVSVAAILPVMAQTAAPSQSAIATALRPIPLALRGGHQGLPVRGSADVEVRHEMQTDFGPAIATRRESIPVRRHAATVGVAVRTPHGCPSASDTGEKPSASFPMITFEFNSAQLKPESLDTLRNLGKALNEDLGDQKVFTIEGHTDAVGTPDYNQELSRQRAEAVKDFLVKEVGVAESRLQIIGKGYCELANPRDPYGGENRRVVVINQTS
ncbi:MAG: OmpA family protein [Alphaproteobacteria bacterium]|nr:OmpA family protein [Alphaproteobacteria bacterium]MBV9152530.1 OmpA family protein [Alphaproteobacteria bacterium]MBV9585007.1 OmpA family protein [Alphaproteobacteria bacterium]